MEEKTVVGIDLGGTKVSLGIFALDGCCRWKALERLNGRKGGQVGALIVTMLAEILSLAKERGYRVMAVGLCVPGIYDRNAQSVWAPNIPGWEAYPLKQELETSLAGSDIPVIIDNDRSCTILAEVWKGRAKGCENALFVAVGTGIGLGIWANGQVLGGAHGIAGAIGWLGIGPDSQGGNLEASASGIGIASQAARLLAERPELSSELRNLPPAALTAAEVFKAYGKGDPIATGVLDRAVTQWGLCTAHLISIFDPETIIFGGGIFGPAAQFMEAIRAEAKKSAQPISFGKVNLGTSALDGDAAMIGAAYLALRALDH